MRNKGEKSGAILTITPAAPGPQCFRLFRFHFSFSFVLRPGLGSLYVTQVDIKLLSSVISLFQPPKQL